MPAPAAAGRPARVAPPWARTKYRLIQAVAASPPTITARWNACIPWSSVWPNPSVAPRTEDKAVSPPGAT
jgi:hypothetical protein